MNTELPKFWVTCPDCKRKFGISAQIVAKYFDRIFTELEKNINRKFEEKTGQKVRKRES